MAFPVDVPIRATLREAYARLPRRLVLRSRLCPGDVVMLTAAVRDLHRCHPGRFLTDVRTPHPELWAHNPYITPLSPRAPGVELIDCHYPLIGECNRNPIHFVHGYIQFLGSRLGAPYRPTAPHGDVRLSATEKAEPSVVSSLAGRELPYWIVVAGGKRDYTIKWWDHARYQEVVDHFRDRVLFVQVGELQDCHPRLNGVLDLRGRTTIRQLVHLVFHASGVLCPVTFLMHLAAAVEIRSDFPAQRPCVVVAGGREPPSWEAYPTHQYIHRVGALPCCEQGGCWRARTLPLGDGDLKDDPSQLCLNVVNLMPRCMDMISTADVVRAIESYREGGQFRYLTVAEAATAARLSSKRSERQSRPVRGWVPVRQAGASGTPAVTICVLTYGDYPHLVRSCLDSLQRNCRRSEYYLVVGANAPSTRTLRLLERRYRDGSIDRLHLSPVNLNKSPMMRRMFAAGIESEFVWWFDDDVFVEHPMALRARVAVARRSTRRTVAWGHRFFMSHDQDFSYGFDVRAWIRAAPWYQGRQLPSRGEPDLVPNPDGSGTLLPAASGAPVTDGDPSHPDGRWYFLTGGNWFARRSAIRALDWPDPRLVMNAEDILFAEAIRQQGWTMKDIGPLGVRYRNLASRGQPKLETMQQQMENSPGQMRPPSPAWHSPS